MKKLMYASKADVEESKRWVITTDVEGFDTETNLSRSASRMSEESARKIFDAAVADVEGVGTVTLFQVSLHGWERIARYEP